MEFVPYERCVGWIMWDVTTLVRAWFKRGEGPPASGVSPTPPGIRIGLAPEVGGCARPNHGLTPVVTASVIRELRGRGNVTTLVRAWFKRGEGPPASAVSPIRARSGVGLTPEVGGCARPNHGLTPVVTVACLACAGI